MSTLPVFAAWVGLAVLVAALAPLACVRLARAILAYRDRRLAARARQVVEGKP